MNGFGAVFPFGHGLSYTRFDYADLEAPTELAVDGCIEVSCSVRNSGTRAGEEVVQLYIRDRDACVLWPVQQLVGFQRVALAPAQEARISWKVPTDLLAYSGIDYTLILEPVRSTSWSVPLRATSASKPRVSSRVPCGSSTGTASDRARSLRC